MVNINLLKPMEISMTAIGKMEKKMVRAAWSIQTNKYMREIGKTIVDMAKVR